MATGDLCKASDVATFLSLGQGQDTDVLGSLVTSASAFINSWCSRNLLQANYTESRNGNGGDTLYLRNGPVTAVASVTVDGVAILPSVNFGSGFVFDSSRVYLRGYTFCRGVQNVAIAYTAGFDPAAIPADLAQACVEAVAAKYKRRTDLHVNSKILDGQTINFNALDMPASAKVVLQQYARTFMT